MTLASMMPALMQPAGSDPVQTFVDAIDAAGTWVAWYLPEADYITLSGSDITQLDDMTGGGNHLVTGDAPNHNATGAGNSHGQAEYDGVSEELLDATFPDQDGNRFAIFNVATHDGTTGFEVRYSVGNVVWGGINASDDWQIRGVTSGTDSGTDTSEHLWAMIMRSSGSHTAEIDGAAMSSDMSGTAVQSGATTNHRHGSYVGSLYADASMAMFGVFTGVADATAIGDVESAVETFYGITMA